MGSGSTFVDFSGLSLPKQGVYALGMRFWSTIVLGLGILATTTGCESAHITDIYIARDEGGRRKTDCIRPEWTHYFVTIKLFSAREDTIVTPVLRDMGTAGTPLVPIQFEDEELAEFGSWAPGKGDEILLTIEHRGPEDPNDSQKHLDLPTGYFQWEYYLDDHSEPDDLIPFTIAPACP